MISEVTDVDELAWTERHSITKEKTGTVNLVLRITIFNKCQERGGRICK